MRQAQLRVPAPWWGRLHRAAPWWERLRRARAGVRAAWCTAPPCRRN